MGDGWVDVSGAEHGNAQVSNFNSGSRGGVRSVNVVDFLKRTYDSDFWMALGFIKIDTEGNDGKILGWIKPLIQELRPTILIEFYVGSRRNCRRGSSLSPESLELLTIIRQLGYVAYHPETMELIDSSAR